MAIIGTWILLLCGHYLLAQKINLTFLKEWRISRQGRQLMLKTLMTPLLQNIKFEESAWPHYKFYSNLFAELLDVKRQFGANITQSWQEIRTGLAVDVAIEESIESHLIATSWQLLLMAIAVWVPIVLLGTSEFALLSAPLPWPAIMVIIILQIGGAVYWYYWPSYQRQKCFAFLAPISRSLITLQSLVTVSLDLNRILARVKLSQAFLNLPKQNKDSWLAMETQLLQTIQIWRKEGRSPAPELKLMCQSFWAGHEQQLHLFKKKLDLGQLSVMAISFVGSYLVFMGALLHGLMQELTL